MKKDKIFIKDSDLGRGQRLRHTRKLIKLTGTEFAEKLNLHRGTLSMWENGNLKMPMEGARSAIKILNEMGIQCNIVWLWFGIGSPPYLIDKVNQNEIHQNFPCEIADPRADEIINFNFKFERAITALIKNSSMKPFFLAGNIVGGYWETDPMIDENPVNCIIELNKKIQVRRVKKINEKYFISFYTVCENETEPFALENVNLDKIALIKRFWTL